MELKKGTPAHKAYFAGFNAYAQGKTQKDNPYTTAKNIALSNWWVKGFDDIYKIHTVT